MQAPKSFVVKRRLKGFVTELTGDNWRVVFVVDAKEVTYDLPAKPLKDAGITARFQPFEMDELESVKPGTSGKLYEFRPLAEVDDAALDPLNLDPDRKQKLQRILAHFKKSQG